MVFTIVLAVINILVFVVLSFGGQTENVMYMLDKGAAFTPFIVENGEYYRLFTSMFMHFGFTHLFNNMISLVLIGRNVESVIGKWRFALIYFASGLAGNVCSLLYEMDVCEYSVSAGASGAIFGLTGALLALTIIYHGQIGGITRQNMLIMVVFSLYLGFASDNVDNLAHIGGLVAGMLLTFLTVWLPKKLFPRSAQSPQ